MMFASYDDSGRILYYREMSVEDVALYPHENLLQVENVINETLNYISNGIVKPRPIMPLVVVGSVITGIPQGATVTLGEQSFTVDDGEADIEGYTGIVKITCWPYLDAEVTL